MVQRQCRSCKRTADTGAYCEGCDDDTIAKALKPEFKDQRKKGGRHSPPRPTAQPHLFRQLRMCS